MTQHTVRLHGRSRHGATFARLSLAVAVFGLCLFACNAVAPPPAAPAAAPVSTWLNSPRLPDFSFAGYHSGERAIPRVPVVSDARRFGATGDGVTDDTVALVAALDATHDGALLLPAGRYVLRDTLHLSRSHVVLRGEGPDRTVLVIPASLAELHPLPPAKEASYSFGGGFVEVKGALAGEPLAAVTSPAVRGDRQLALTHGIELRRGELVRVRMNTSPGLLNELLGGLPPGPQTSQDFAHYVDWAVPVAGIDGSTLLLSRRLRVDVRPEWSAEVVAFHPTVEEVGVEDLSFEFAGVPKRPHLEEEGWNAILMKDVANSWVENVTITDADNGVNLVRCRFCQVECVRLRAAKRATPSGHHGLWAKESQDCLFTGFSIDTLFVHDVTVEGLANGNVFMRGTAQSMNLDHHRNAPYENLFTDLDAGTGERLWQSSGSMDRGPHAGVRETVWNVRHSGPVPPLPGATRSDRPGDGGWPGLNVIQVDGYADTSPQASVWVDRALAAPPNLYEAQLAARRAR